MKKIFLFTNCLFITALTLAQSATFQWTKTMGGSSPDYGQSIAVDPSGNIYTTGSFQGTVDFDPNAGIVNLTASGGSSMFISKLNSLGNLIWAKSIGPISGSLSASGFSIALDIAGNVYTTGYFQGTTDFDPGLGTFNLTTSGFNDDIFISKLDSSGNFIWAKGMGGSSDEIGLTISLDASGNVYTSGYFEGTVDFDPNVGIVNLTPTGSHDIFISKLDPSGNFLWAKHLEGMGTSFDNGWSVVTSASGNIYLTGAFQSTIDFDPSAGAINLTSAGSSDIFILKLDSSGNFIWAKQTGGASNDVGLSIKLDESENIYTTGQFTDIVDFDPNGGTFYLTSAISGSTDIFISKIDSTGNFIWAKGFGCPTVDGGYSIALDSYSNVYTTGFFTGTADFDPGAGVFNLTSSYQDVFISKLDVSGNFVWAKNIGGVGYNRGSSISADDSGNVFTTGHFSGTADFDPDTGIFNLNSTGGSYDIFIHKMSQLPVGMDENKTENNVLLYPNPSSNQFYLEYNLFEVKEARFIIYDIAGKILFENVLQGGNRTEEITDLNLANGIYLYKIISSDNKILKQSKLTIIK